MPKKEKTITELITIYNEDPEHNPECLDAIIHHYSPFALKIARDICYTISKDNGITVEELYAVGLSTIHIAVCKCNIREVKNFYPYWCVIAKNQMFEYIKQNSYLRGGKTFRGEFSLDEKKDNGLLAEAFGEEDKVFYTHSLTEEFQNFIKSNQGNLTKKEKRILALYLDGYMVKEIAKQTHLACSSIHDIYQRALRKIRRYYKHKH